MIFAKNIGIFTKIVFDNFYKKIILIIFVKKNYSFSKISFFLFFNFQKNLPHFPAGRKRILLRMKCLRCAGRRPLCRRPNHRGWSTSSCPGRRSARSSPVWTGARIVSRRGTCRTGRCCLICRCGGGFGLGARGADGGGHGRDDGAIGDGDVHHGPVRGGLTIDGGSG